MSILKALKWLLVDQFTFYMDGGGGSAAPTTQTVNQVSIPPEIMPYATSTLAAAKGQLFNTNAGGDITGIKPYTPYSTDPSKYVAGFSPLQTQAQTGAGQLTMPGQFGTGTQMTGAAGLGSLGIAGQAAGAGQQYNQMATNPYAVGSFMNPYLQQALQPQLAEMGRQGQIAANQAASQATAAGAFGGTRGQLAQAEAQRNAMLAQQNLIGQGYNNAYNQALQNMQFGANLGLQGQQAALSGLGQAGQMGSNLANIGQQQLSAQQGILGTQAQMGATQQQQQQNIINQAIQNYAMGQQYPMMQLGEMMNLVRGTPTQVTSTQNYQASPSTLSQLGGLAATGIGAYGALNKGAKEGGAIKEQRFAEGGITSLMHRQALADEYETPQQVRQSAQNKVLPPMYAALLEQDKINQLQRMNSAKAAAAPMPQGTVKQQMDMKLAQLEQARRNPGITQFNPNVGEEAFKGGGIVAFDDGGDVPGFAGKDGSTIDFSKYYADPTRFSHAGISPDDEAYGKELAGSSVGNAGIDVLKWAVPGYIPYRTGKWLWDKRITGYDPKTGKTIHGYDNAQPAADTTDAERAAFEKQQNAKNPVTATPAKAATSDIDAAAHDFAVNYLKDKGKPVPDDTLVKDKSGAKDTETKSADRAVVLPGANKDFSELKYEGPKDRSGEYDKLVQPKKSAAEHMAELKGLIGTDEGMVALKDKLAGMEEKAKGEEERAPWMALMKAGLATMAGTSPYALTNIGAGGAEGLKEYAAAKKDLNDAAEKRFAIQSQLAQAAHAEQVAMATHGKQSEQADIARYEQNRLAKIGYLNSLEMANAKGNFDAAVAKVSAGQKQQELAITAQHYNDWYNVSKDKAQKDLQGIERYNIAQQTQLITGMLTNARNDLDKKIEMGDKKQIAAAQGYYDYIATIAAEKLGVKGPIVAAPTGGGSLVQDKSGGFTYQPAR